MSRASELLGSLPKEALEGSGFDPTKVYEYPTQVYFELAGIIAANTINFADGCDDASIVAAQREARSSLAYNIGYNACFRDLCSAGETELERLINRVKGE